MAVVWAASITVAPAGEIGHDNVGATNIRDYFGPQDPGFYGLVYKYYDFGDHLNNDNGDKIISETVNMAPGLVSMDVNLHLHTYALMPMLLRVAPCDLLGASYAAYIALPFAYNNVGVALSVLNGVGGNLNSSRFGLEKLCMQPIWLDRGMKHWDISLANGFYARAGKYSTQTIEMPKSASVTEPSKDNISLGYSMPEAQAGIAWYPMTNKATAVTAAGTYEYDSGKRDFDVRPGQIFTINWGVSQYLPLSKNHELLLEVGPAGYDSYQITDSTGGNAFGDTPRSRVNAVGGQLGLAYVPWNAIVAVRGFYEYAVMSRFPGASIGVNFGIKF